jgi:hypothetical protein
MRTDADKERDTAQENVEHAILNLSKIVVTREVHGWDEYHREYRANLQLALNKLMDVRNLLDTEN